MKTIVKSLCFFVVAALLACASSAAGFGLGGRSVSGVPTGIADGDTFYMVLNGVSTRFRLAQIDAPEKGQPFGRRAEESLRELIGKREITASWTEVDRYGRPVVQVKAGSLDVNAEQVRRGFAWVYRAYATEPALFVLESEARAVRRGLWADPGPVEPKEWRKANKK